MLSTSERITAIAATDDIEKARDVLLTLPQGSNVQSAVMLLGGALDCLYVATDKAKR